MAKDKYNKQKINKEARRLLKEGTPKQEVFELLKEKYKVTKIIADILKTIPSKQAIDRYGKWNTTLLALLILTTVIFLGAAPSLGIVIWYGLLIYAVARKSVSYYVWISILSAISIIGFLVIIFTSDSVTANWLNIIILFVLIVPSLFLPIWLEKKLCPKPKESKVKYTNSKGQKRLKIVYEFPVEGRKLDSEEFLE